MGLKEKLEADVKTAMLAKNEVVRDTLRLLLAELKRLDVQDGKHITPDVRGAGIVVTGHYPSSC